MSLRGHTREIVLSALLLVVLFYYLRPAPPDALPGQRPKEEQTRDVILELMNRWDVQGSVEDIRAGSGVDQQGNGRNLFEYGKPPVKAPTPEELAAIEEARRKREEEERLRREEAERLRQLALEKQQRDAAEAARRISEPVVPPPPPKAIPPSINLKYIGMVGEPDDKIAIFLDGAQFLMAREGETVKEDFRIEKISYDTLQMGFTDPRFEGETRLMPMGE